VVGSCGGAATVGRVEEGSSAQQTEHQAVHPAVHQAAFERSTVPSVILDNTGRVLDVNDAYLEMSGRTRAELLGSSTIELIHADDLPGVISGLDALLSGARSVRHQRRHQRGDGSWIPIEVTTCLVPDPDGSVDNLLLVQVFDHRVEGVEIDPIDELMSRQLFQPAGDAACIHDADGRVAFGSPNLDTLLGRPPGWIIGRRLTDPDLSPVQPDGSPAGPDEDPARRAIRTGSEVVATLGVRTEDGRRVWLSVVAGAVERQSLPARSSLRDITELVEAQREARRLAAMVEEQLAHRANHDDLTGLTARRIVLGKLDEELDAGRPASVVFVDLDGFKAVNDELGHLAGDDLLVGVADRLTALAAPSITVGRAGGDEFVAVTSVADDAERFAAAVRAAAAGPDGLVPGGARRVGASVGVAHSTPGDTRTTLLTRADRAMYDVKRAARRSQP
jgi:diguanylate cyclase (GGDEF)-like protein/PAS domain S-box-containing protein